MTGHREDTLATIPAEFSGHSGVVGCPRCRAVLIPVFDEDGRGTTPLEVRSWDLAASDHPGVWETRGGWIHAAPHRCGARRG